jgi:hypothetical protein
VTTEALCSKTLAQLLAPLLVGTACFAAGIYTLIAPFAPSTEQCGGQSAAGKL